MQNNNLLKKIAELLTQKQLTIATAESCTGGLLASTLTDISGSSTYFIQGVIAYSNQAKQNLLKVSQQTLSTHGAVSKQTAQEMAEGIRNNAQTTIGISTTGIAGPTGGTTTKPVGLVYIGLATPTQTITTKHHFHEDRTTNKQHTVTQALHLLHQTLTKW